MSRLTHRMRPNKDPPNHLYSLHVKKEIIQTFFFTWYHRLSASPPLDHSFLAIPFSIFASAILTLPTFDLWLWLCPPPYVLDESGQIIGILNPAFKIWYEKDLNILIWLNSTLSKDIILFTVGVTSSQDLWLNLEHRFGGISTTHIQQLYSCLHYVDKGNLSISDYLQRIKGIADSLMVARALVSNHDMIAVTLNGLPDEYKSFIDSIMFRISTITLDKLHGLLINNESPYNASPKFHKNNRGRGSFQRNNYGNCHKNFNNSCGNSHNCGGTHGNYRNNSRNRNNFGGNRNNFGGRTPYQICNSFDHEAIDCYERMNHAFARKIPPAKLAAMCAHTSSKQSSPTCLMDLGAVSHITNGISAIQSPYPYFGEENVYVGDGQGIAIHHIGNSTVSTPHASFRLSNILHVAQMKFNSLSAYQFLKDNYCSLTLGSNGSEIKYHSSGRILFRGPIREGFYPFQDCAIGKNHKLSFASSTISISTSLELIHCDFTKYTWLFPMKAKSEVFSIFVSFKAYVENMIGNKIKVLRSYSKGEFTSSMLNSFLSSCKWVFRIKRKPDGTIDRYKAHLVAKRFHQQKGIDFKETFSPIAKPVTNRILLTLVDQNDRFLNQLDISNLCPQSPQLTKLQRYCQLNWSFYGLKQAPRAWYDKLRHTLLSLGFANSQSDCSLFVHTFPSLMIVLSTKKKPTVARSSTEAEYRSFIFKDINFPLLHTPTLWCDNVFAIYLASNHVFDGRTKHVEVDYYYIQELVLADLVKVLYVNIENQIADIHTKSLSKAWFKYLQSKLSLGSPPYNCLL
ncbi:hypothetical protein D8674_035444 [Pyrus ussuriensis x Pyrus communis]|uniref:Uncharacterized protein n=1 Tax=Pyrus ussuriensis x Pyrus communis TaxID=2448454 RepID=A0A5N5GCU6_9ROSA|nr:hypothetical protein D8674_035444 [Pyrus ussuriensis x Pyrus communis]